MNKPIKKMAVAVAILTNAFCVQAQEALAPFSLTDWGGVLTTSGDRDARLIADRDLTTSLCFDDSSESWIQYRSYTPVIVTAISIVNGDDREHDPRLVMLRGSNDGVKWSTIGNTASLTYDQNYQSAIYKPTGKSAYTYYRLTFSKRASEEERPIEISECQFFGTVEGDVAESLISKEGTLTGEKEGLVDYKEVLPNLIDSLPNTKYTVNGKHFWVQYELPEAVNLQAYSLTNCADLHGRTPRSWELLGSEDGVTWSVLDQQINRSFHDVSNNKQYFFLKNNIDLTAAYDWGAYAEQAQEAMQTHFWSAFRRFYIHSYTLEKGNTKPTLNNGFNYWWNAHNLDALVDAYRRTGDEKYTKRMADLIKGCIVRQKDWVEHENPLENWFFDDMDWMGLATLRAFQATGDSSYLEHAVKLWQSIVYYGWDDKLGGGIYWNKERSGKNACANAPAMILSARLYEQTHEQEYLDWAIKIHDWTAGHLMHKESGLIYDGMGIDSSLNTNMGWLFTYNQGTYMGGCAYLYRITGEQKYLDEAVAIADIVTDPTDDRYHHYSPAGIMNGGGGGDGGLFDGIFMRYLSQMIRMNILDEARTKAYTRYMVQNAYSLCKSAIIMPDFAISNRWTQRMGYNEQRDGSVHLSGLMLLELVDELKREGYLKNLYDAEAVENNRQRSYNYFRLEVWGNGGDGMTHLSDWNLYGTLFDGTVAESMTGNALRWEQVDRNLIVYGDAGNPEQCALYTSDGAKLMESRLDDQLVIPMNNAGNYILRVVSNKGVYSQKVVIY